MHCVFREVDCCVYICRVVGVSDLCDYPAEVGTKPKVSHSCFNSADMSSAEVDAHTTLPVSTLLVPISCDDKLAVQW